MIAPIITTLLILRHSHAGVVTLLKSGSHHDYFISLGNVAFGKEVVQSGTFSWSEEDGNEASFAVDGDINNNFPLRGGQCASTYAGNNAWWEVRLGDQYVISHITIYGSPHFPGKEMVLL